MTGAFADLDRFVLFAIGNTPVTLGGVIVGVLIIAGAAFAAKLTSLGLRRLRGRARYGGAALYIFEKLATYGLVIIGVVLGLSTIGLNLSTLAVFAGAIGVGIGLGLQGIVKEFVSGLALIFDRVMNIGDYVELADGRRGLVHEIGPRAVRIRTNDNVDILVPNSHFIEGPVINWTLHNQSRRIHIPFSVAYGSDREKVRRVVLEAARSVTFTLPEDEERKSQVWLVGFGGSGLNFELIVWPTLEAAKRPAAMQAAYTWAIAEALERAGLEIPFTQVDLRLRSLFGCEGVEALKTLGLTREEAQAPPPRRSTTSTNDAAEDLSRPLPEPPPDPGPDAHRA